MCGRRGSRGEVGRAGRGPGERTIPRQDPGPPGGRSKLAEAPHREADVEILLHRHRPGEAWRVVLLAGWSSLPRPISSPWQSGSTGIGRTRPSSQPSALGWTRGTGTSRTSPTSKRIVAFTPSRNGPAGSARTSSERGTTWTGTESPS